MAAIMVMFPCTLPVTSLTCCAEDEVGRVEAKLADTHAFHTDAVIGVRPTVFVSSTHLSNTTEK